MRKWLPLCLAGFAACLSLPPAHARAETLPLEASVRAGRPPRPVTVTVDGPRLEARARRGEAAIELPIAEPEAAEVSEVRLAKGARVAVVRVRGDGQRAAALLRVRRGEPEIFWSGRLDPHGDPGERRADTLEIADRTGDGEPDVVVGQTRESIRICGQDRTLLFPQAVDPRTMELRPVVLRRLPEDPSTGEREVTARTESPGPDGAPVLGGLSFYVASSVTGADDDPALLPAPVALSDGDPETLWMEGHGSEGRWEFATARFEGGRFPIRALAVTPTPPDADRARRLGRPKSFWLVGDRGPRLHVTLPDDPAARPGEPYWIVPERPLHWRCLSIVLDDVHAPQGARRGTVRTALAEIRAYTDLDFGEGVDTLVADLGTPGRRGAESAELLASTGAKGVKALAERWDELDPLARRRAMRALHPAARDSDRARRLLVHAARTKDARLRDRALRAFREAGPPAAPELAELVGSGGELGDRAALALVAASPEAAVKPTAAALAGEGSERPALRRALARAVRRGGEAAREPLSAFVESKPPARAAAAAALALARVESAQPLVADLLGRAVDRAERFEDRWRLVAAAADATGIGEQVEHWLAEVATDAEEWMLRGAAIEALAEQSPERARTLAERFFGDSYPRVRAKAATALGGGPEQLIPVATLARRDPWPLVRRAAVRTLAAHPRALPVLRAAVHDRAATVRAAAIETLTELEDREAWPKVRQRLEDAGEDEPVRSAALAYAHRLCIAEAVPALAEILDHALAPDAGPRAVDLGAEAIRALAALGGPGAREALARAAGPEAPGLLRATVQRARRHEQGCR